MSDQTSANRYTLRSGILYSFAVVATWLVVPLFNVAPVNARTISSSRVSGGAMSDKRVLQSFGEAIQQGQDIVVAKKHEDGTILVLEVLKGNASLKGKTLTLRAMRMWACEPPVKGSPDIAAFILAKNWQTSDPQLIEVYNDHDKISALRCLVLVYAKSERQKYETLAELCKHPTTQCHEKFAADPTSMFKQEFFCALSSMKDSANFAIVQKMYMGADNAYKLKLMDWMADTCDNRAIPLLIEAIQSDDKYIRTGSVCKLIYNFPGAPGVDTALEKAAATGPTDIKSPIYFYLSKRNQRHKSQEYSKQLPPQTPYQRAEEARTAGRTKESAAQYIAILESKEKDPYIIRSSALNAAQTATRDELSHVLLSVLPFLIADAAHGNYLEVADTTQILRKLHSQYCVDPLIVILARRDFMFGKANREAAFALHELGENARKKAAAHLLKEIEKSDGPLASQCTEQLRLLLELVWIGESSDIAKAADLIKTRQGWASSWASVEPVLAAGSQHDEGAYLIDALKKHSSLTMEVQDWIVVRLGDLRDQRAALLLVERMQKNPFTVLTPFTDAIQVIANKESLQRLEKIVLDPNDPVRWSAFDIICNVEKEKSLPMIRRLLKTPGGVSSSSLLALSRFGTPDDLVTLMPMNNYWTGDRANHYWILQAVIGIRERSKAI